MRLKVEVPTQAGESFTMTHFGQMQFPIRDIRAGASLMIPK